MPVETCLTYNSAQEIQDILDTNDSQSPDIGPPPVSRFDIEEPITFNHIPSAEDQPDLAVDGEEVVLPMNLETRRKRRESGPKPGIRRMSLFESPPEEPHEAMSKSFKTGAKRKFSVQEDGDKAQNQTEPFQFNRRGTPASVEEGSAGEESRPLSATRPILSSSMYLCINQTMDILILFRTRQYRSCRLSQETSLFCS